MSNAVNTPESWKIVPVQGGGVCVVHSRGQTSNLVQLQHGGYVKTENKSVYQLLKENMTPGMWAMQLSMKRPEIFKKLQNYGIL